MKSGFIHFVFGCDLLHSRQWCAVRCTGSLNKASSWMVGNWEVSFWFARDSGHGNGRPLVFHQAVQAASCLLHFTLRSLVSVVPAGNFFEAVATALA